MFDHHIFDEQMLQIYMAYLIALYKNYEVLHLTDNIKLFTTNKKQHY